jgi:shikimate dehydrogenase
MGSGKSAVGRALAGRLQRRHWDTDTEIEREAGCSIADCFAAEGEAAFRQRETAMLSRLLTDLSSERSILSTGGGTPLRPENTALLQQIGTVVWLQASPEAILSRIGSNLRSRPLLADYIDKPYERVESLLATRSAHYAALADFAVETSKCAGPLQTAEEIIRLLGQHQE